ncbi:MAG: pilus assembly PilX family protein [Arenicella sp.]
MTHSKQIALNMQTMKTHSFQQQGIALVSALLLLLAITLVGVTSLRMNLSGEEMVSSSYMNERARQGAEAALQFGEREIQLNPQLYSPIYQVARNLTNGQSISDLDCVDGFCLPLNVIATTSKTGGQWVGQTVWEQPNAFRTIPDSLRDALGLTINPQYIIELLGHTRRTRANGDIHNSLCDINSNNVPDAGDTNQTWTTYPYCRLDPLLFRVTALGSSGPNGQAKVMLQSTVVVDSI